MIKQACTEHTTTVAIITDMADCVLPAPRSFSFNLEKALSLRAYTLPQPLLCKLLASATRAHLESLQCMPSVSLVL